ncbi:hypothetical protein NLU66_16075 [Brachybacterium sp. NBEC-018]|uniref:hypothetical protein n=1 Tax=Brachybacterium sp. NBEC-018 TaxID=2996004 RepID=UPI0021751441|nr:hypothetical protein [Brachybacterium sp. NBEC-018]UVY83709.1 hypothetical protein NLU66_16075 [Brachybacterium sp. NBEC-018]
MTEQDHPRRPRQSGHPHTARPHRAVPRSAMLAGLGAAGLGLAASLAPGDGLPAAHAEPAATGLPVLHPGDDWEAVLAATPQVQLEAGARYELPAAVTLPSGTLVEGNGAVLVPSSREHGLFTLDRAADVTLRGLRLHGVPGLDAEGALAEIDVPLETAHTAIRSHRARNLRVTDCDLVGWRGAGIAATGDAGDDVFSYGLQITGCRFEACTIGLSAADRSEYSLLASSVLTSCRLGVWCSSGNWTLTGTVIVGCHGALYSIAAPGPFGEASKDNWGHGSVTGCTLNHASAGAARRWTRHLELPIGGTLRDPGSGVVLEGVLPPTFSANTLWYTDVTARGLLADVWYLTGCALSDLRITQDGGAPVRLLGHQANAGAAHAPVLVGDVRDVLAP